MGTRPSKPLLGLIGVVLLAYIVPLPAQSRPRAALTLETLLKYPGFYHGRAIALVAQALERRGTWQIALPTARALLMVPAAGVPPSAPAEFRGTFLDVARVVQDHELPLHPNLAALVQKLYPDQAIARDTVFAIDDLTWADPPEGATPSLRQLVLAPAAFDGKTVTVRGRFRGQNLFGDLPAWPRQTRWDFVLQAADAAIWVTGQRPKGRGFDLDPTSRRDAGTWLEVSGMVHVAEGLTTVEAKRLALSQPAHDLPPEPVAPQLPPEPPPTVIFSAPMSGEADISRTAVVRVQFSRNMAAASFADHVHVTYGEGVTDPVPAFTARYLAENRGLEIRFASPLALGATVFVSLDAGVTASDGSPLSPVRLSFTVER